MLATWILALAGVLDSNAIVDNFKKSSHREIVTASLFRVDAKDRYSAIMKLVDQEKKKSEKITGKRAANSLMFIDVGTQSNGLIVYYSDSNPKVFSFYCTIRNKGVPFEVWYSAYKWCGKKLGVNSPNLPLAPSPFSDAGLLKQSNN